MNLWLVWKALGRHKALVVAGALTGVVLALLSLYSVSIDTRAHTLAERIKVVPRSLSVFEKTTAVLIDVPGYGLMRTDLPIEQNAKSAPAFAYLATSAEVVSRVESQTGPLKGRVEVKAIPVEESPVVQIVAEGKDAKMVERAATLYAQALSDYVREYQDLHSVQPDVRVVLRPVGSSGPAAEMQSRAVEVAAIMFLLPLLAAVATALVIDNLQRAAAEAKRADEMACAEPSAVSTAAPAAPVVADPAVDVPVPPAYSPLSDLPANPHPAAPPQGAS